MFHMAQNFETQCQKEMAGILVRQFPRMKTGKGKIKIILNHLICIVCNDKEMVVYENDQRNVYTQPPQVDRKICRPTVGLKHATFGMLG